MESVLFSWAFSNVFHLIYRATSVAGFVEAQTIHSENEKSHLEGPRRMHLSIDEAINTISSNYHTPARKLSDSMRHLHSFTSMDNKRQLDTESSAAFNVVRGSQAYVDKTLLLKEWITSWHGLLYVTAPAGFGKSNILDMIRNFCDAQYDVTSGSLQVADFNKTTQHKLFVGTKIFSQESVFFYEHFMQYNVIYLNFEPLRHITDYVSFQKSFCRVVNSMIEPYTFLLSDTNFPHESKSWIRNCTQADPESKFCLKWFDLLFVNSGNVLLTLLGTTFARPIILLIDGYDSFLYAQLRYKVLNADWITTALDSFIERLVKHTYYPIDKALFMGTLDTGVLVSTLAVQIAHLDFFENESIAKFFGFSQEEVKGLLKKFSLSEYYSSVKDHCGGYSVLKSKLELFSIKPILRFIQEKKPRSFLKDSFQNKVLTRQFADIFADYKIGSKVITSIFNESTSFKAPSEFNYQELFGLKESVLCAGAFEADDPSETHDLFLNLILETGLFSVSEKAGHRVVSAANDEAKEILLGCLERSEFSKKLFDISEKSKVEFQNSVISFKPDQNSVDRFGYAVFMMFFGKHANSYAREKDYIFSMFTNCKMAARDDLVPFEVEGGVKIQMKGGIEGQRDEIIDLLLFWKHKGFGVIIEADFECGARVALDRIVRNRFFDIFKTREEYLKHNVEHLVLIGFSMTREGDVSMNYLVDSTNVKEAREYRSDQRNIKVEKRMKS